MSSSDTTLPVQPPTPGAAPAVESFGGYVIGKELGRGGMGIVYRAVQESLKRNVALKMLIGRYGAEELARFLAEAETAAALQHSNIVHIYEVGEKGGVPFFAMEFVDGGTLADRLAKGVFAPREAAALMATVARAVHFAHENGVVHRDLKPGNVLLDHGAVPKVADFGIAKRLLVDAMLTSTGAIMGTPCYMAPEQAGGTSHKVGPAADIYSLGAMLYELLTGRPPFLPHESEVAMTVRVLSEDPVSPAWHRPDIPRELEAICMMCLGKEIRERYVSAAALADDLQRFLNDEPILARPPTRIHRSVKWVKRHPWRTITWAALFMLAGAGLLRAWQWEMYQRPRFEYATGMDLQYGGIEGVGALSESEAQHNAVYLRLTRRGRSGPIVKAEAINPKGKPAAARDVLNYEIMPTWLQGAAGFQDPASRGREAVSVDITFENGEAVEFTGRDRNGRVTVRVHYDRALETNGGAHAVRARFLNMRSFDYTTPSGASNAEFFRDKTGRDVRVAFFNSVGKPARNGEGVFGYELVRGSSGRVERLVNLNESGGPMANNQGLIQFWQQWNTRGRVARFGFSDAAGNPTTFHGMATVEVDYDEVGNLKQLRRLNLDNALVDVPDVESSVFGTWAVKEFVHNGAGEITEIKMRSSSPSAPLPPVDHVMIGYDENGYPNDLITHAPGGLRVSHHQFRRDERGNVVEQKRLSEDGGVEDWMRFEYDEWGNCKLNEALDVTGGVSHRALFTYDGDRLMRELHENANGTPHTTAGGYTQLDRRYHENGYRIEDLFSGYRTHSGAVAFRKTYDVHGRLQQEVWLDGGQKPVSGASGWASHRLTYREDTFAVLTESYEDAESRPARTSDGYASVNNQYTADGVLESRILAGFDGQEGFASKHQRFDARGFLSDESYFDKAGGKARCQAGYHHYRVMSFTVEGLPLEAMREDYDPAKYSYFQTRSVSTWRGNLMLIRMVMSLEDREGQLTPGFDQCSGIEQEYDEQRREIVRIQTGCVVQSRGAPIWRTETEWGDNGLVHRRVTQALDEERHPIAAPTTMTAARTEETFSENGRLLHMVQTGFPEALMGFSSLEASFTAGGRLETATHRRADGTPVEVRVIIAGIAPGAQEKSAELRVGDELASSNGEPVANSYAFSYGNPFPGGWVEVLRDGQRIRIDGFKPGKLGIVLLEKGRN